MVRVVFFQVQEAGQRFTSTPVEFRILLAKHVVSERMRG